MRGGADLVELLLVEQTVRVELVLELPRGSLVAQLALGVVQLLLQLEPQDMVSAWSDMGQSPSYGIMLHVTVISLCLCYKTSTISHI